MADNGKDEGQLMTSYLKVKPYRNPKLLKLAKDAPCSLCGSIGTTVSAHSNYSEHGKGMGKKAEDCYIAFLCYQCHMEIDQGAESYDAKKERWYKGMAKTYHWLLTSEHLIINPLAGCNIEYKDLNVNYRD